MLLKISSAKCRPFCAREGVINHLSWPYFLSNFALIFSQSFPEKPNIEPGTNCILKTISLNEHIETLINGWKPMVNIFNTKLFVEILCISIEIPITHWGRATHICVGKLTTIGSDTGLSLGRRQAIIWTNAGILLLGSLGTNFSEILIGIQTFSFKKMDLKMTSAKCRPSCLGLNVLRCNSQEHE